MDKKWNWLFSFSFLKDESNICLFAVIGNSLNPYTVRKVIEISDLISFH